MKTVLLIPAFKPSRTVIDVVDGVAKLWTDDTLTIAVIDDGSGPEYRELFDELAARYVVLRNGVNLGKGGALKNGMNYALASDEAFGSIVTADADGQHLPGDIINVARAMHRAPDALRLGVRSFDANTPLRSRFGNELTRLVLFLFNGLRIRDTQTGLRAMGRAVAGRCLKIPTNGYEFELEMLLREHQAGTRIDQTRIETVYEPGNPSSHFNPIRDSARIYFVFIRYVALTVIVAMIDYLLFGIFLSASFSVLQAMISARAIAAVIFFTVARKLVFNSDKSLVVQLVLYGALTIGILLVTYPLIQGLRASGIPTLLSKAMAEGLLFFASFSIQRLWIFRRRAPQ